MRAGQYDDLLPLPHHVSATRPQMSMQERAAQFSPFAALAGFDSAIRETERLTSEQIEPGDQALAVLDRKFRILLERLEERPAIRFTYFVPDGKKSGVAYRTESGVIRKVDEAGRRILLESGTQIPLDCVLRIEGGIFEGLFPD